MTPEPLLDADVSVHDDMRDMSKSSCLFTATPPTPFTAEKSPDLRRSRVGGWGFLTPGPLGQRLPGIG